MEVVIITGMSGAGKSQAIDCLEDRGYYCIDNMPPVLIKNFFELVRDKSVGIEKTAFVMDMRGGAFAEGFEDGVEALDAYGIAYKIIFLEASNDVLARRFNETRRVHPATKKPPLMKDIQNERKALEKIRERADFVIDTSAMKPKQLKQELIEALTDEYQEETFVINVMSFGYKYGIPVSADMVFDMRFIPNPFYVASLKRSTGNSKKVRSYVMKHLVTQMFVKDLNSLVNNLIPAYMREGKFNLNIAFGCTGGQHRSVAMANEFAEMFERQGKQVTLEHRDIKKR
ncbi:MAG: RNase adapter RapZ [Firmicutes bacterium]|nr:RNase adapter RapZ [Bacillota bacterium]